MNAPVPMSIRDFTRFAIQLRGKPFDISRRPWLPAIYDLMLIRDTEGEFRRNLLLTFGRQCEKSTSIGNINLALCSIIPHTTVLYATSSDIQMKEFSDVRLRAAISDSPKLQALMGIDAAPGTRKIHQNVLTKRWRNGSRIILRAVYKDPMTTRGPSADVLDLDEIQDIRSDFIPVIEQTTFASPIDGGPFFIYSGTPKTFDNPLEVRWGRHSTMNEWLVKCQRCNHWNVIETENIATHGLVCIKCTNALDPVAHGTWVRYGPKNAPWEGFRVCQPIAIYAHADKPSVFKGKWRKLLIDKNTAKRATFENENMARSYDMGKKPVTLDQVRRCCLVDERMVDRAKVPSRVRNAWTWMAVDWGTGDQSFTVGSVWTYDTTGRFKLIYAKKYIGSEAESDYSISDLVQIGRLFRVRRIGADWGFGFHANPQLVKAFGRDKVLLFGNVGSQRKKVDYNKEGGFFTAHRTRVMEDCFTLIKRGPVPGGVAFPNWEEFEDFARDILGIYQDTSKARKEMYYDHPLDIPDDFFQTMVIAFMVSQFDRPRPDIQSPAPGQSTYGKAKR